jgi:hypothetical protein
VSSGELRAAYVLVETAALLSTGKLAVAGNGTLIVDSGVLTHSGSLTLNASAETSTLSHSLSLFFALLDNLTIVLS